MIFKKKYLLRSNTEETYSMYGLFDTLEDIKKFLKDAIIPLLEEGQYPECTPADCWSEEEYQEFMENSIDYILNEKAEYLPQTVWGLHLQIDEITVIEEG